MTYELLEGQTPFYNDEYDATKANIVNVRITYPEGFNEFAHDFIKRCLQKDQDKRPSAEELLKHNFLKLCTIGEEQLRKEIEEQEKTVIRIPSRDIRSRGTKARPGIQK